MDLYNYRKQIQKLYDDSVYGNIKGDIYNELSELRIDNEFIENINLDSTNKRITFKLNNSVTNKDVDDLFEQIQEVIKSFIYKNINCMSDGLKEFIESNLYFDSYFINESKIIIVQL